MPINEDRYTSLDSRVGRIESTLQDLASLTSSLAQSSAVFEFKHEQTQRISSRLEDFVERMNDRDEATQKKTIELLGERERRLADTIGHLKEMMLLEMATKEQAILSRIQPLNEEVSELKTKQTALENRVDALEKWLWMAIGGAMVISYIIQSIMPLL